MEKVDKAINKLLSNNVTIGNVKSGNIKMQILKKVLNPL